eukprot:TRINITY_DN3274_c0_g2_i1.p1 TRINITY_DN3274_c0_g2~~TRINITY_DN3274_c0_g2_i1.p1  ORF type:complete len:258 (-),score=78.42 TRINITY_DN3274_c0_g2_i1:98-808(-)
MAETALINVTASVFHYISNAWAAVDGGSSNVGLYYNPSTDVYRIVALATSTRQPTINTLIFKQMLYNQAKDNFHNWTDGKMTYGLHFPNVNDAKNFANVLVATITKLQTPASAPPSRPPVAAPSAPQPRPPVPTPAARPPPSSPSSPKPAPPSGPPPGRGAPPPSPVAAPRPGGPKPPAGAPPRKKAYTPSARPSGTVTGSSDCGKFESIKPEVLTGIRDSIYDFRDEIIAALNAQ